MNPTSRAWIEIDLTALRANVAALRQFVAPDVELLAVVKADAYGHGLLPVARAALEAGASWLGVATVTEGIALRTAGLAAPIAVLCAPGADEANALLAHGLTATVGDRAGLNEIIQAAKRLQCSPAVHIEIETGMGRAGVLPAEAVGLWRAATDAGLRVTGLCTHYADAENSASDQIVGQDIAFDQALDALTDAGARFEWIHTHNSAATIHPRSAPVRPDNSLPSAKRLVRCGALLYGIVPPIENWTAGNISPRNAARLLAVTPVLSLKARVATVRDLPAGHTISYGATHTLSRPSRVATVLLGYGDGYPRRLSGVGQLLLHGRTAPILGRICMDQTVVDVTDIPGVGPGDIAIAIGAQGDLRITVETIAAQIETTEHEITTCLTARLPRIYTD